MIFLLLIVFIIFFNTSSAQHFVKMTDQQWIELALDMIRKGIQQQDVTKILKVVAPEVSDKSKSVQSKTCLRDKLQSVFDNSHKRAHELEKPAFPRMDNPLHHSNFWDFDILDPEITIEGDSALVECELVLWSAPPTEGSTQKGRRANETFVFKVPPKVEKPLPSGDYVKLPASFFGEKQKTSLRSWKLVSFESLLNFLNGELGDSLKQHKQKEGK